MVARKSHPKSRNGCLQCKKRRIKCDEVSPRCNNCTKHEIDCDFSLDPSQRPAIPPRASRKRSLGSRSDLKSEKSHSSAPSPSLKRHESNESSYDLPRLQMEDLELLHHFSTEVCFTLSDRQESHHLWQLVVPQEAFRHDFLMRGILAISALHLSAQGGEKQEHWAKVAAHQQDAALTAFRPLMTNMNDSNCDAFFALSSLVVVYGFDLPRSKDSLGLFDSTGDQEEWLPLIRGVNSIIQSQWSCIKRGRLRGLLHDHPPVPPQVQIPSALDEQLRNLSELCRTAATEGESDVYQQAVALLRDCFVRMNNKQLYECEISIAFTWPVMVPQEFINKIKDRESIALIVLAHYCVILHHLNSYWWLNGWATQIIQNIDLQLPSRMRIWLQWPANAVGLDTDLAPSGNLPDAIDSGTTSKDTDGVDQKAPAVNSPEMADLKESNTTTSDAS